MKTYIDVVAVMGVSMVVIRCMCFQCALSLPLQDPIQFHLAVSVASREGYIAAVVHVSRASE